MPSDIIFDEDEIDIIGKTRLNDDVEATGTIRFKPDGHRSGLEPITLWGYYGLATLGDDSVDGRLMLTDEGAATRLYLEGGKEIPAAQRASESNSVLGLVWNSNVDRIRSSGTEANPGTERETSRVAESQWSVMDMIRPSLFEDVITPSREEAIAPEDAERRASFYRNLRFYVNGSSASLGLGGDGVAGDIVLKGEDDEPRVRIDGSGVTLADEVRAYVDGESGSVRLGGDGQGGALTLRDGDNNERVSIDGESGDLSVGPIESLVTKIQELEQEVADLQDQLAALNGGE
ncbi:hypothetical protein ACFQE8_05110 [Salinirubellus sp. GCM10025818]|uniref:hypothetical protein n=1 Tax=Salinirubellus TaxID=2162630 RepID=UPI0030D4D628